MFKAFSKLFQGTTEYGNQNQKNQEKENEIMPKANTNATVNNKKEEKDMKATTKANAKTKENTMQETENKSTKAKRN